MPGSPKSSTLPACSTNSPRESSSTLSNAVRGTRALSSVSKVLPGGSFDARSSRSTRLSLRPEASSSSTSATTTRASSWPTATSRRTSSAAAIGSLHSPSSAVYAAALTTHPRPTAALS